MLLGDAARPKCISDPNDIPSVLDIRPSVSSNTKPGRAALDMATITEQLNMELTDLRNRIFDGNPDIRDSLTRLSSRAAASGHHQIAANAWGALAAHFGEQRQFELAHVAMNRAMKQAMQADDKSLAAGYEMFDIRLWMIEGNHGRAIRDATRLLRSPKREWLMDRHELWLWSSLSLSCVENYQFAAANICEKRAGLLRSVVEDPRHPHVLKSDLERACALHWRWILGQDCFCDQIFYKAADPPTQWANLLERAAQLVDLNKPSEEQREPRFDDNLYFDLLRLLISIAVHPRQPALTDRLRRLAYVWPKHFSQARDMAVPVAATLIHTGHLRDAMALIKQLEEPINDSSRMTDYTLQYLKSVILDADDRPKEAMLAYRKYSFTATRITRYVGLHAEELLETINERSAVHSAELAEQKSHGKPSSPLFAPVDEGDPLSLSSSPQGFPKYVSDAIGIIGRHDSADLSVSRLAQLVQVSDRTLRESFQKHLGVTPKKFIVDTRLDYAMRLISTTPRGFWTVTDLARVCGFGHAGRFSKVYRERFGQAPSAVFKIRRGA